jgi:nucleoid-associated protein YgaU
MKPALAKFRRLSLALSALAFILWAEGVSADIKVASPPPPGSGPTLKGSKQSVSLGDDSGKKPSGALVPPLHTVKKGDTLWDICDTYFANPWQWPRVWSYNPDILNPHWIYPGEVVRLK